MYTEVIRSDDNQDFARIDRIAIRPIRWQGKGHIVIAIRIRRRGDIADGRTIAIDITVKASQMGVDGRICREASTADSYLRTGAA